MNHLHLTNLVTNHDSLYSVKTRDDLEELNKIQVCGNVKKEELKTNEKQFTKHRLKYGHSGHLTPTVVSN